MASIDPSMIDWSKYEEFRSKRSNNEAWNEVRIFHKVLKEGEYREIWICNYCNQIHTGNVGRVEAHLAGIKIKGVTGCLKVPPEVKERMTLAVKREDVDTRENKRRKYESGIRNSLPCALQSRSSGLNPIGEGNPSPSTLLGVNNGSGEVSPGSAEMDGWSSVNPQGDMDELCSMMEKMKKFYERASNLVITESCVIIQNTCLEEIGDFATRRTKEMDGWLKTVEPVRQRAVDLLVNIGFTPEQVRHLPKIDISAEQVRRLTDDLFAKRTGREIVQLQKDMEELGKQIITLKKESEDFFNQTPLKTVLIEFMKCRRDNSLRELYLFNTFITGVYIRPACQQQIDRATENLRMSVDSDDHQLQYEDDGREENRNIEGICRSTDAVTEPWGEGESFLREMTISVYRFIERALEFSIRVSFVTTQKTFLVEIGEFATRRMKEIDGWLKSAEPVGHRAVDLLVNIGFAPEQASHLVKLDISAEQVRRLSNDLFAKRTGFEIVQLQKNMEELGKQIRKLKKESEDFFNQIPLKTALIQFMADALRLRKI